MKGLSNVLTGIEKSRATAKLLNELQDLAGKFAAVLLVDSRQNIRAKIRLNHQAELIQALGAANGSSSMRTLSAVR